MTEILNISPRSFTKKLFKQLLSRAIDTKEWMVKDIYESRAKDYNNEFRSMVYNSRKEMDKVIGALSDNAFILQQQEEFGQFRNHVNELSKAFQL